MISPLHESSDDEMLIYTSANCIFCNLASHEKSSNHIRFHSFYLLVLFYISRLSLVYLCGCARLYTSCSCAMLLCV